VTFDLDSLDLQLLEIVQTDSALTAAELAERVPLSPSAVQRRLNRMRQAGVIEREAAVLSAAFIRGRVTGVVHVQMASHAADAVESVRADLAALPQVQIFYEISGAFDLLLVVIERDLEAFNAFTATVLGGHPNVLRFETAFVKTRVKQTLAVPVGPDVR